MSGETSIELPASPPPTWSHTLVAVLVVSLLVSVGLAAWASQLLESAARSGAGRLLPLALGLLALSWPLTLGILCGRAARGGKAAWALSRRAGFPWRLARSAERSFWWAFMVGVLAAAGGAVVVLAQARPDWRLSASIAALTTIAIAVSLWGILARTWMVALALHLARRLQQTTLAKLESDDGSVELALRVPPDAPTIEIDIVPGRWASLQLRLENGEVNEAWPDRLVVVDESGSAALDLGSFELCGWRYKGAVTAWTNDPPPLVRRIETATGRSLTTHGQTTLLWEAWALAPGDALYIVGDATAVRRGLGSYRGGGSTTLGTRSDMPAVAYMGEEGELRRRMVRELVYQTCVAVVATASLLAMLLVIALLVP